LWQSGTVTDLIAADVYEVALVDKNIGFPKRIARWAGTVIAGVLQAESMAPTLSDLVIMRGGGELRRITVTDVGALANLHDQLQLELETTTPEAFARSWELPLPR
jgi:hypothetical protein